MRKIRGRKIIWKKYSWKISKFYENSKLTDPSSSINPKSIKNITPRQIVIQFFKTSNKEKMLKVAWW